MMRYYEKPKQLSRKIVHIITILIVSFALTPFFRRNIPLIFIGSLILVWVIFARIASVKSNEKTPAYLYLSIAWFVWIIGYRIIGISDAAWGNYLNQLVFFIFLWIGKFYTKNMDRQYCRKIFNATIFVAMVNIIHNIYLLYMFPNASEELNFSDIYYRTNVGSTMFSLFALLLFCIILIVISDTPKKAKKMFWFTLGTLCVIYIFEASRAIAVMFLIVSIFIYLYSKLTHKKKAELKIIIFVATVVLLFLILLNAQEILMFISNKINNNRLSTRLNDLANSLSGNNMEDGLTLESRVELYKLSITTFFRSIKNFIFGVGYHTSTSLSFSWIYSIGVGNHSEFLDLAAKYGFVGVLIVFNCFGRFLKSIRYHNKFNKYINVNLVWIVFLLYSFVNNTFDPSIGALIFLMVPIYLENRDKNSKEEEVVVNN